MRPQAPGRVLTPHARADRNPSAATRWKKPPAPRPPPPPNPIPPWNLPSVTPRARPFPSLYKEAPPCRASARYAAARKRSGTPAWSVRAAAVAAAEAVEGLLKDGGAAGRDEVHHVPGAEGTQYLRAAHQNDRIHDASAGGVPERQGEAGSHHGERRASPVPWGPSRRTRCGGWEGVVPPSLGSAGSVPAPAPWALRDAAPWERVQGARCKAAVVALSVALDELPAPLCRVSRAKLRTPSSCGPWYKGRCAVTAGCSHLYWAAGSSKPAPRPKVTQVPGSCSRRRFPWCRRAPRSPKAFN